MCHGHEHGNYLARCVSDNGQHSFLRIPETSCLGQGVCLAAVACRHARHGPVRTCRRSTPPVVRHFPPIQSANHAKQLHSLGACLEYRARPLRRHRDRQGFFSFMQRVHAKERSAAALSKHWALPCAQCLRSRGAFLAPTVLRLGNATMTLRWVPPQLSGASRQGGPN